MSHSEMPHHPTEGSSSSPPPHGDEENSNINASPDTNLTQYSPEFVRSKGKGKAPASSIAAPYPGAFNFTYNFDANTINGNVNGVRTNGLHGATPSMPSVVHGIANGNNGVDVGAAGPSDPFARLALDPKAMSSILDHFNLNTPKPSGSGPASPSSSTASARITPVEEQFGAIGQLPSTPMDTHLGPDFTAKSVGAVGISLSRYVLVKGISMEEEKNGTAQRVLSESQAFREAISHAKREVRIGRDVYYEYVFAFDDFSTASCAVADPSLACLNSWVPLFIDKHAYLDVDRLHPDASSVNEYEGRVEVGVYFIPHASDQHSLRAARQIILNMAHQFGAVRCIKHISEISSNGPDAMFRMEFESLSASRAMVRYLQKRPSSADHLYSFDGQEHVGDAPRATTSNGPVIPPIRIQVPAPLGNRVNVTDNNVVPMRIVDGVDVRTTIMLRNIPNRVDATRLKHFLDQTSYGRYDFSYLRIDFQTGLNVGYAFINFLSAADILPFYMMYAGKPFFPNQPSKKVQMSYATCQGIECLVEKFRNSVVMKQFKSYRPKLWYTVVDDFARAGEEKDFPDPNNQTKLNRSAENVRATGLFAPNTANHANGRGRQSNFDRGTPRAAAEEARATPTRTQAQGPGPVVQPSASRVRFTDFFTRRESAVRGPSGHAFAFAANATVPTGPSSQVSSTYGTHGSSPQVSDFGFPASAQAYAGPSSARSSTHASSPQTFGFNGHTHH